MGFTENTLGLPLLNPIVAIGILIILSFILGKFLFPIVILGQLILGFMRYGIDYFEILQYVNWLSSKF